MLKEGEQYFDRWRGKQVVLVEDYSKPAQGVFSRAVRLRDVVTGEEYEQYGLAICAEAD